MKASLMGLIGLIGSLALSLAAAAALLAPSVALATFDFNYTPDRCMGVDKPTNDLFVEPNGANNANRTTTQLHNPTGAPITVVCPIGKRTSGPGIMGGDNIQSMTIGATPAGGFLRCTMNIWRVDIVRDNVHSNLVYNFSVADSSSAAVTMTLQPTFGIGAFWSNNGPETIPPNWEYADMQCTLPAFASLGTYTAHEAGSAQSSRIYPSSNCHPETTSTTGPWRYQTMDPDSGSNGNGGTLFAATDLGGTFAFHCPVPNNVSVEFAVLPSSFGFTGDQAIGCNLDVLPFSGITWAAASSSSGTAPYQVLPLLNQPSILTPTSGTHELVCGQKNGGVGDGSLVAYRTIPPMPRTGWTASASRWDGADVPARALDANTTTRWTDGKPQSDTAMTQYFTVDMKSSQTLRQIVMSANGSSDYPRIFQVYVSTDGNFGGLSPVYTGAGTASTVSARFAEIMGRYIRVVLIPSSAVTSWWSIEDFNVYQ